MSASCLGDDLSKGFSLSIADEVPIQLSYNGTSHTVLMATPHNLHDLAIGFSLTDGICRALEIGSVAVDIVVQPDAVRINLRLPPTAFQRFLKSRRARTLRSNSSCGVCGIETVDQLPHAGRTPRVAQLCAPVAVRRALIDLPRLQQLNAETGAVHAAAWATLSGRIVLLREDVGRHNALDKLIGARLRLGREALEGFCLITSRCSYEMVQKAAVAGIGMLVAISAPTSLAIEQAKQSGMILVALARSDRQFVYAGASASVGDAPV